MARDNIVIFRRVVLKRITVPEVEHQQPNIEEQEGINYPKILF